ncbi:nucleotide-diphospho-sugar transferase, partial [Fomitiporia mediterranea MF3/22]|uniref:nucleotide-diphospho-sugar transferase n=1 Tax=Fomitiporia mediterranea (strain MF3/22) TaxID=694068 RepID=UPI0004408B1E
DTASLIIPKPDERAVVTTLYSEEFFPAALALGRSLQDATIAARRILLYFSDRISDRTLCQLRAGGWELRPIVRIPPPNGGKGVHKRFFDQYSKLQLWTLDKIGIKSVVYLDADMVVRQNFDELWALPFEFAAVPDVYEDNRGFALSFNAGMLFLRPSTDVFKDMMQNIATADYRRLDAEQGFLNMYFASQVVRLPYIYNANLVIKQRSPAVWQAIEKDMRVVHYTMMKPFLEKERHRASTGHWEAELELWDAAWKNTFKDIQGKC